LSIQKITLRLVRQLHLIVAVLRMNFHIHLRIKSRPISVILGTVVACALAILIATLAGRNTVAAGHESQQLSPAPGSEPSSPTTTETSANTQHFEGMVTCTRCGAKHSPKSGAPATQCAINCVREGASFALIDGDKTYELQGDLSVLKQLAGQRAKVVGVAQGNTIKVSSIAAAS
jgi:hypothetical protein